MRDEPSAPALLDAARRALAEEVAPNLTGRPRYVALMVANAIGVALREIEAAPALDEAAGRILSSGAIEPGRAVLGREVSGGAPDADGPDAEGPEAALVRAIRDGGRDGDPALHAALTAATDLAAAVWKPRGAAG